MAEGLPGHLPKRLGTRQWGGSSALRAQGGALPHPCFTKWPQCARSSAEDAGHVEMSREIGEKPVTTPSARASDGGGRGHSGSSRWASNLAWG